MPPRISARRLCLALLFVGGVTLLLSQHYHLPFGNGNDRGAGSNQDRSAGVQEQQPPPAAPPPQALPELQSGGENGNGAVTPVPSDPVDGDDNGGERGDGEGEGGGGGGGYIDSNAIGGGDGNGKAWFFSGGTEWPENSKGLPRLFPDQADGDRIIEQLMYVPEDYQGYDTPEKVILAYNGLSAWGQKSGSGSFHGCPVSRCSLTDDRNRASDADAILYKDHLIHPGVPRPPHQVWIMYYLECPYHTQSIKFHDVINWTATYRRDSDLVAPYERWTYYDPEVKYRTQGRDYAANKTKKVAWFVSNCGARNGRLAYARELGKYISVDIYGTCGPLKCPRSDKKCFELLDRDYKFYLAFENSNCRDYITEKFYVNGLGQNVLPIVMGARPLDYLRSAPDGSYIHVDEFAGPAELAAYLHRLDKDNSLYNSYFRWKGTGEFINTYFWCRLCAMMHSPNGHRHYDDVNEWWRGTGVCTSKSWRNSDFV